MHANRASITEQKTSRVWMPGDNAHSHQASTNAKDIEFALNVQTMANLRYDEWHWGDSERERECHTHVQYGDDHSTLST